MNVLRNPARLLTLLMTTCTLTACQTTPDASYSVTKEAMESAVRIEHKTLCEITRPVEISRAAFDGSPLEARLKMRKDVEKWAAECGDSV